MSRRAVHAGTGGVRLPWGALVSEGQVAAIATTLESLGPGTPATRQRQKETSWGDAGLLFQKRYEFILRQAFASAPSPGSRFTCHTNLLAS